MSDEKAVRKEALLNLVTHIRPARADDPICYAWQVCASGDDGAIPVRADPAGHLCVSQPLERMAALEAENAVLNRALDLFFEYASARWAGTTPRSLKPSWVSPAAAGQGADDEIARIVQSVNEWDDRTSPDDYPDHLLITSDELTMILRNFAATLEGSSDG